MARITRKTLIAVLAASVVLTLGGLLDIATGESIASYHNVILNLFL